MIPLLFITILLVLAVAVLCLSSYFGRWRQQPIPVTITHTIGWYIPLLIICVLPLDIATTFFEDFGLDVDSSLSNKSIPLIYVSNETLNVFWHAVYWTSQLLTWFILPIMQSYAIAGDFTILRKLRTAFIDNAIYYGSYLLVFGSIFIYLLVKRTIPFDVAALKILLITTSNTWGLFLVVVFLGYGLVEVPRVVWRAGDSVVRLRLAYFQLSKHYLEYIEDEEKLIAVIQEVCEMHKGMSASHNLRAQLDVVFQKVSDLTCAEQSNANLESSTHNNFPLNTRNRILDVSSTNNGSGEQPVNVTLRKLVSVHKRLKKTLHHQRRAKALWIEALRDAAWHEDLVNNIRSNHREFQRGVTPFLLLDSGQSYFNQSTLTENLTLRRLEWYWKCLIRSWLLRIIGVLLIVISLLFVWSECTFFVRRPILSIVALGLQCQSRNLNYNSISLVSLAALGYMSLCIYFSAYRLRLFNYYRLVPNHNTDTTSLIFYGTLLCRLTPSLCLNFLGLAHLDSHILPKLPDLLNSIAGFSNSTVTQESVQTHANFSSFTQSSMTSETAFTKFMGHLDLIPLIAGGFNIYFPILIVVFCLFTFFRIGSRILHYLGIPQLIDTPFRATHQTHDQLEYDVIMEDTVKDGKMLLYRERTLTRTNRRNKPGKSSDCKKPLHSLKLSSSSGYINEVYESDYKSKESIYQNSETNIGDDFYEPIVEYSEDQVSDLLKLNLQSTNSYLDRDPVAGSTTANNFLGSPIWSKISHSIHDFLKPSPK